MDELKKIKEILNDKLIVRIDKTNKKTEIEIIIIFINPEKKQTGHCIIRIPMNDKKFMEEFKKIIINKFNISIKGFKNWKKSIQEY